MVNDHIADFLTRIRNAGMSRKTRVDTYKTNMNRNIADILVKEGYIKTYREVVVDKVPHLRLFLKYENGNLRKPLIRGLQRASRSGLRKYCDSETLPKVMSGFGLAVMSTSKGVISGREAKKLNVGGEHLCSVW